MFFEFIFVMAKDAYTCLERILTFKEVGDLSESMMKIFFQIMLNSHGQP